jgi:hypothetical protein
MTGLSTRSTPLKWEVLVTKRLTVEQAHAVAEWVARSSGVPCARRGYHANGTLIVRPSMRSTTSASAVYGDALCSCRRDITP